MSDVSLVTHYLEIHLIYSGRHDASDSSYFFFLFLPGVQEERATTIREPYQQWTRWWFHWTQTSAEKSGVSSSNRIKRRDAQHTGKVELERCGASFSAEAQLLWGSSCYTDANRWFHLTNDKQWFTATQFLFWNKTCRLYYFFMVWSFMVDWACF